MSSSKDLEVLKRLLYLAVNIDYTAFKGIARVCARYGSGEGPLSDRVDY